MLYQLSYLGTSGPRGGWERRFTVRRGRRLHLASPAASRGTATLGLSEQIAGKSRLFRRLPRHRPKPGTPESPMSGRSGPPATGSLVVTASPRKLPDRTCDTIEGMLAWTGLFR